MMGWLRRTFLAGFFVTGTSAQISAGSALKVFLDEDLTIAMPRPAAVPVGGGSGAVAVEL